MLEVLCRRMVGFSWRSDPCAPNWAVVVHVLAGVLLAHWFVLGG